MKYLATIGIILVLMLVGVFAIIRQPANQQSGISESQTSQSDTIVPMQEQKSSPEMKLDMSKIYKAVLKTEKGSITIEFDTANTPITSNNFISLAREGFYNGTVFHRTIDGFMIQGGDPEGTGRGGPGFQFDDEYLEGSYTRGVVAMANSGPNTNGSQFFIMHKDYNLPPAYVIFAKVIEGMEVVDAIATAEVTASFSGELSVPVNPVSVQSIEIIEE